MSPDVHVYFRKQRGCSSLLAPSKLLCRLLSRFTSTAVFRSFCSRVRGILPMPLFLHKDLTPLLMLEHHF